MVQFLGSIIVDSNHCVREYHLSPQNKCFKPIWIPNAFTPNGQGPEKNELFQVVCTSCKINYLKMYNAWGQKVYDGVDAWDGTYMGQLVPNGIYAYLIGVTTNTGYTTIKQSFNGSVQVLR